MKCKSCSASNSDVALFCRSCGHSIGINEIVECEKHSGSTATGICIICGKPVCDDCSLPRDGMVYCDHVKHSQLSAAFTRLAFAATEFEGELIAKNLEAHEIPVLIFSGKLYSHFCRLTDEERISIYVSAGRADEARRLLNESELSEFLSIESTSP